MYEPVKVGDAIERLCTPLVRTFVWFLALMAPDVLFERRAVRKFLIAAIIMALVPLFPPMGPLMLPQIG